MKKKSEKQLSLQFGFTLIELMVTMGIMATLFTIIILGLAGQRSNRNLQIASNELVTNIRKLQTDTLVSRGVDPTQTAQYYILKFDTTKPTEYIMQAIYNSDTAPTLVDTQKIKLPTGVRFAFSNPLYAYRTGFSSYPTCALLTFKAPFAKILVSTSCVPNSPTFPYAITNSDDYYSVVNFVANGSGVTNSDTSLDIVLVNDNNTKSQTVTVKGISGLVTSQ
jgi:prepilin-type N-terminal cleavage/methylation domain-containing protein